MNLRRILQLALTSFVGQGVAIITQLLIPPFFLRFYPSGIQVYGEWIALSASITYLGSLNYGVQTYASNQMTILYNRGEVEASKEVQASALRLLGLIFLTFCTVGLVVFAIPIAHWLRLHHVGAAAASITLYLLIVQMAVSMIFNLLTNSYMAVGQLHRGTYWAIGQRLFSVLAMAVAIWRQASFPTLATIQLVAYFIFFIFVLIDIRRGWPVLLPSLRYGSWKKTAEILKPSGHFGLISIAGFLTWQGPVLVIQRILGSTDVATFSLVRVVFQMSRQLLSVASGMVSQDITMLFGQRDWVKLRRLYDLSERVVLFLIPIVSIGSLLMCPFLFTVWLHKRTIYEPLLCTLMAITSAVLGIKEHKTIFQSSSNEHEQLSWFILAGYTAMLAVSIFTLRAFGLTGFMLTWITWEVIQTVFVIKLNARLFPPELSVTMHPLRRLAVFMTAAFAIAVFPAYRGMSWSLPVVVAVACLVTAAFGVAAYYAFGVGEVRGIIEARIRRRFAVTT